MISEQVHRAGPDPTSKGAGKDNELDRTHARPDESTGRVQGTGPDVAPARAGEDRETGQVRTKDQASSRRGPGQTPKGAGEDNESDRAHTKPVESTARAQVRETERVHEKAQPGPRQGTSAEMDSEQVHRAGPDQTSKEAGDDNVSDRTYTRPDESTGRVQDTGPDVAPARAGVDRETGRVRMKDQRAPDKSRVPTRRWHGSTRHGQMPRQREPGKTK